MKNPIPEAAGEAFFDATNHLLRENSRALISVIAAGLKVSVEDILSLEGVSDFLVTPTPGPCLEEPEVPEGPTQEPDARTPVIEEPIERLNAPLNPCKCRARVFGSGKMRGLGPQCSRKKVGGSDYCKKHHEQFEKDASEGCQLAFGNYDEERPSVHLSKGPDGSWLGKPCCWADEKKKSKRGRKKKVVEEPVTTVKEDTVEECDPDFINTSDEIKESLSSETEEAIQCAGYASDDTLPLEEKCEKCGAMGADRCTLGPIVTQKKKILDQEVEEGRCTSMFLCDKCLHDI